MAQGYRRRQMSDYGGQLREKQKVRRIYFVLEKQFRRHFCSGIQDEGHYRHESAADPGATDSTMSCSGSVLQTRAARHASLVRHGHFVVNGRKTDIPSFIVKVGDEITVRPESRTRSYFKDLDASGILRKKGTPEWLSLDPEHWLAAYCACRTGARWTCRSTSSWLSNCIAANRGKILAS